MNTMTNTNIIPLDQVWESIRSLFNEACHANHLKNKEEADFILKKELPLLIDEWKRRCNLTECSANHKLKRMFIAERQLVANTYVLRKAIVSAAEKRYDESGWSEEFSAPQKETTKEATATRIQFDDVSGMIDAVQAAHFVTLQQGAA